MMFEPFWWLAPIEYGFHSSKSIQRPSRPPHTRLIVLLRGTAAPCAEASPIGVSAETAATAAAPLITSRRRARPVSTVIFPSRRVGSHYAGLRTTVEPAARFHPTK